MKGHIRERSPGYWAIVIDLRDPATGKRRRKWHSFVVPGTWNGSQTTSRGQSPARPFDRPARMLVSRPRRTRWTMLQSWNGSPWTNQTTGQSTSPKTRETD